jgi:replicative superfamily II helicase
VVTAEHIGAMTRAQRERVERAFRDGTRYIDPNVLSCTPTLELGIDIGDLSAVILASVRRRPASYVPPGCYLSAAELRDFAAAGLKDKVRDTEDTWNRRLEDLRDRITAIAEAVAVLVPSDPVQVQGDSRLYSARVSDDYRALMLQVKSPTTICIGMPTRSTRSPAGLISMTWLPSPELSSPLLPQGRRRCGPSSREASNAGRCTCIRRSGGSGRQRTLPGAGCTGWMTPRPSICGVRCCWSWSQTANLPAIVSQLRAA